MRDHKIRIAIADDHKGMRRALTSLLEQDGSLSFIFEADDGQDLLIKLAVEQPEVLLLDIKMPKLNGIEALKVISKEFPEIRILMLSTYIDEVYVIQCLEYGINGYLTKDMEITELHTAINLSYRNEVYFSNLLTYSFMKSYAATYQKRNYNLLPSFSADEIKILKFLTEEKSVEEISSLINVSKRTVELKRDKMREKANVKTIAGLLLYAYKRGIID
jgi:DNA-binding NarL/FixJ family response regulator